MYNYGLISGAGHHVEFDNPKQLAQWLIQELLPQQHSTDEEGCADVMEPEETQTDQERMANMSAISSKKLF